MASVRLLVHCIKPGFAKIVTDCDKIQKGGNQFTAAVKDLDASDQRVFWDNDLYVLG